jgi:hypothetical protein
LNLGIKTHGQEKAFQLCSCLQGQMNIQACSTGIKQKQLKFTVSLPPSSIEIAAHLIK